MSAPVGRERLTETAWRKLNAWLYGWIEDAVGNGPCTSDLLAEHEDGDLYVPSRTRADWWDRKFNPRNPTHWVYWLRSRRRNNVAMIESS